MAEGNLGSKTSAKKEAAFLKDVALTAKDTIKSPGLKGTNESLRSLSRERKNYGDKMLSTGIVLVICPDPITGAIGLPLIAAGKALKSRASISIKDVLKESRETATLLRSNLELLR